MTDETAQTDDDMRAALNEWFGVEPLHEDLSACLRRGVLGQMIHNRFVIEPMFVPQLAKRVNKMYATKSKAAKEALYVGNWSAYITLHERPYRLEALVECLNDGLSEDAEAFWDMVAMVWTDSENIHEGLEDWRELWSTDSPGRMEHTMDEDEKAAFAALPDIIPVWRGCTVEAAIHGMSWTTNRDKAIWFANRFADREGRAPHLATGTVAKDKVLAHFLGRNEHEIVVFPENVEISKTEKLRRKRR